MLIKVENLFGDSLISGKVRSIGQLKYRVNKLRADTHPGDFASVFCARYGFERLPYESVPADYYIDLDINYVYKPYNPGVENDIWEEYVTKRLAPEKYE